ncbi:hypothetical protein RJ40_00855 [Methanofollis aquaemaris]|uniref:Restriction system protein Mrr-like N-terminal domain-containing protein n=1 Tax=Methanofollis aquaemaris TaxID=126734 RepID=A0A8A3S2M1_9EURY|nr:hypothetical protein [Methanofollis aquaemaris]QSZ66149.1 hypothetical protein RJ40_00855 [Methanofollis aquaemaris]
MIEELGEIIQGTIQNEDPELLKKKNQIGALNLAMNQLTACELHVPEDLKLRKESLEDEVARMGDPDVVLPVMHDELVELVHMIEIHFNDSRGRSGKARIRKNKKSFKNLHKENKSFSSGEITPRNVLKLVLIDVLRDMGGRGGVGEIKDEMIIRIGDQFTDKDKEQHSSGYARWWYNTQWVRQELVFDGVLRDDSPRGVWELK